MFTESNSLKLKKIDFLYFINYNGISENNFKNYLNEFNNNIIIKKASKKNLKIF